MSDSSTNRRAFLRSAIGFLAAPAIVRASSLMAISVVPEVMRLLVTYDYDPDTWTLSNIEVKAA